MELVNILSMLRREGFKILNKCLTNNNTMSYSYTKMYLLKKLFLNLENACSFQEKQFLFFLKGNPLN